MNDSSPRVQFEHFQYGNKAQRMSAEWGSGTVGLVMRSEAEAQDFLLRASGMLAPVHGRLRVDGHEPHRTPQLRAKMPTLLPHEPQLPTSNGLALFNTRRVSTGELVASILSLRRKLTNETVVELTDLFFVQSLLERPARELDALSRRKLSLSLALSLPHPTALWLFEPLRGLDATEASLALDALVERAESGAIVVIAGRERRLLEHLCKTVVEPGRASFEEIRATGHYTIVTPDPESLVELLDAHSIESVLSELRPSEVQINHEDESRLLAELPQILSKAGKEKPYPALLREMYPTPRKGAGER